MEIWKKINIQTDYSVSNFGNVWNDKTGNTLKLTKDKLYLCVTLSVDCKPKKINVHNLVAEAFLGPRPERMFILHGDRG